MAAHNDNWQLWLDENADRFLLFARQQTRCESDAEDVLQDALIETWKRAGHSAPPAALVYATIRRRSIEVGRSYTRRELREQSALPDQAWLEPDLGAGDDARLLQSAISQLRFEYAEVLTLKIWGGLTFRAIAETLDIPQNTAASRYRYAIEDLRKCLKGVLQ